jgi:hypothetical protein
MKGNLPPQLQEGGDGMSPTKATRDVRQGNRGAAAAKQPPKATLYSGPPATRSSTLHHTMTDGSTCRSHANQMRPRATHQSAERTVHHLLDFLSVFNLRAPSTQGTRGEPGPAEDKPADLTPGTSSQESPRLDSNPKKVSVEPRKSKQRHIPVKKNTSIPRSRSSECVSTQGLFI